jgi:prevent-host-death family protein
MITTFSSRAFNQDSSGAKKASINGPVFITDRGKPAHVLLSIQDYQRLLGQTGKISEMLSMPGADCIDFAAPTLVVSSRPADLT